MSATFFDLKSALRRWGFLVPASALGLFAGRLVSEILHPDLAGAIAITLVSLLLALLILRRFALELIWPSLLLYIYVFYPYPDPRVAATVAILAISTYLVSNASFDRSEVASRWRPVSIALCMMSMMVDVYRLGFSLRSAIAL